MKIAGFQSISLIDYPGVLSSIVFTQGCVFRCAYCHNPELIRRNGEISFSEQEILDRLDERLRVIEGVVVTGGEPTLQPDLPEFLQKIRKRGLLVKLDTNGVHPALLKRILDEKLVDYIAMDIKNVWERYDEVIRTAKKHVVENCRKTFELIQNSGVAHEFRTTICPGVHTTKDLLAIAQQLLPGERYCIQDTKYAHILDENLPREHGIDLTTLLQTMTSAFPHLELSLR